MFINLHVHSHFSQLDGYGDEKQYIKRAKELRQPSIAITDHASIDGALKWQKECLKNGIKPVIGCELYMADDMKVKQKGEKRYHMTVVVKNETGWHALLRLLTIANLEGYYYRPRLDFQTFLNEEGITGLTVMTGCAGSILWSKEGFVFIHELRNKGIDVYLEIMPHCIDRQDQINTICLDTNSKYGFPLIATNDCHYVYKDQWKVQEVLLAIQRKALWTDKDRWKFGFRGLHLRSAGEMIDEFERQGVVNSRLARIAMMNTVKVAEQCWDFRIPKQDITLPKTKYEKDSMMTAQDLLHKFCSQNQNIKFPLDRTAYVERYTHEMEVIRKKDFAGYLLVIYELVEWCRKNDITVGLGRGSAAGSLVLYLLGVTGVDPLTYGLLFERFLPEYRIDFPDIDLDFESDKCEAVRRHLEEEYGQYNVAGISTFLRMKSRAAIRDVGRVFGINGGDVDTFAKSIKGKNHDNNVVAASGNDTKEGQYFSQKYPEEFQITCALEGTSRGKGQHAAGLIVSGEDLRQGNRCSLELRKNTLMVNWDMHDSEYNGLLKIDVLKLDTLSVLNEAKRLVKQNSGMILDYDKFTYDDGNVFKMLSEGHTAGIFQFSGYACRKLCIDMGVSSFNDMVAIVALARPGVADSGMAEQYVERKKGQQWPPIHPVYEGITKETYGVIVYQEQVMKSLVELAGFDKSDSDRVRKIIGKKRDAREFEPYKLSFFDGCKKQGTLSQKQAEDFWEMLLHHADYSFNKSHSVCYAAIGYLACWLKCHYPAEFFASQLTYGADKEATIKDAQRMGFEIVTPKVGLSDAKNWMPKQGKLYMPFVEINGIGDTQAEKCMTMKPARAARKGFFDIKPKSNSGDKVRDLLEEIKAFDKDHSARPDNCLDYFQYEFGAATCQMELPKISISNKQMVIKRNTMSCQACALRQQASRVVLSSKGQYNALALAEAPGANEDLKGIGLIGDAGDLFWGELGRYGITREMIHYGNCCKCYPKDNKGKRPTYDQVDECFNRWMMDEILSMDCRLLLACGNVPLYALTGKKGGITELSGEMEYLQKLNTYVIWCMHPSAVLHNRKKNLGPFEKGVKRFAKEFKKVIR